MNRCRSETERAYFLQSKYIKRALVNLKFEFGVESLDLKFDLKCGNSNESTNFPLKLQNSKFSSFRISYDEWDIGKVVGAFF